MRTGTTARGGGPPSARAVGNRSHPAHCRGAVLGLLGIGLVAACTAPGVRPNFGPQPAALIDTMAGPPGAVIATLATRFAAAGMQVHRRSDAEGYIESDWFDPVSQRSVGADHSHSERVVRLRAWADSLPPAKTEFAIEAVYRRTADPSSTGREEEIIAPPGHPGDALAQRLLSELHQRFPTPAKLPS